MDNRIKRKVFQYGDLTYLVYSKGNSTLVKTKQQLNRPFYAMTEDGYEWVVKDKNGRVKKEFIALPNEYDKILDNLEEVIFRGILPVKGKVYDEPEKPDLEIVDTNTGESEIKEL